MSVYPGQINAERNVNETFICLAQGGPGNMFSWSKLSGGVKITESSELVIMVDSASVGGTYQCTVENMAGNDSATAVLNGEICVFCIAIIDTLFKPVIPVISQPPVNTNVTRTESLVLVCIADGFPVSTIIWTHNGTIIDPGTSDNITITEVTSMDVEKTSKLTVTNTTFNDSGDYVCVVTSAPFTNVLSDQALILIQGQLL